MVGAGGIGCELLKTLVLSGFQDIHIVSYFGFRRVLCVLVVFDLCFTVID